MELFALLLLSGMESIYFSYLDYHLGLLILVFRHHLHHRWDRSVLAGLWNQSFLGIPESHRSLKINETEVIIITIILHIFPSLCTNTIPSARCRSAPTCHISRTDAIHIRHAGRTMAFTNPHTVVTLT